MKEAYDKVAAEADHRLSWPTCLWLLLVAYVYDRRDFDENRIV